MNVTVKSNGATGETSVFAGGHELKGITRVRFTHDAGEFPTIEIDIFGTNLVAKGRAVFYAAHPLDGDAREVAKITFADGSEWEAR